MIATPCPASASASKVITAVRSGYVGLVAKCESVRESWRLSATSESDPHLPLAAHDRVLALLANRLGALREVRVPFSGLELIFFA